MHYVEERYIDPALSRFVVVRTTEGQTHPYKSVHALLKALRSLEIMLLVLRILEQRRSRQASALLRIAFKASDSPLN